MNPRTTPDAIRTPRSRGRRALAGLAAGALLVTAACGDDDDDDAEDEGVIEENDDEMSDDESGDAMNGEQNIVEIASNTEQTSTLASAVESAGLAETLSGEGPFTVFAPTDDAFEALPEGLGEALLLPENEAVLTEILQYHVVPAELTSEQLSEGLTETVLGESVGVALGDDGNVFVGTDAAMVIQPDIMASNGVIHLIDAVLLSPTTDLDVVVMSEG